ncbi:BolA/IbaG family iron-sulfur metabolism protein [Marinomonas dokdonensis]|uniref:BolA/IbaG family iron-sulfur metabolism protein n=1 Tax=Marinomonas dokdonensis TaxID=328224 RepID=UPI00405565E4
MIVQQQIESRLKSAFNVEHIELVNESYKHNVPTGSESHFKLILVSDDFKGKMKVKRHQLVYGALATEMDLIHALAMHPYTTEEWAKQSANVPSSPNCLGGE